MGGSNIQQDPIDLQVKNIGCIEESSVTLLPGLNVLLGEDHSEKYSVMEAITATYGNQNITLRNGATEGFAKLTIGSESCTHHFARSDGRVVSDGDPCLDHLDVNDMFAFLLESNEVRRSLVEWGKLNDVLHRATVPEDLWTEATELSQRRDRIDRWLSRFPETPGEFTELRREADDIFSNVSGEYIINIAVNTAKTSNCDPADHSGDEEIQRFEELHNEYCRLDEVEAKIDGTRETIEQLETNRQEIESRIRDIDCVSSGEIARLEEERCSLQNRMATLKSHIELVQHVIKCNEQVLESDSSLETILASAFSNLAHDVDTGDAQSCWACGGTIENTSLERLQKAMKTEHEEKIAEYDAAVEQLEEIRKEYDQKQTKRQKLFDLEEALSNVEQKLADRRDYLQELNDERKAIKDQIGVIKDETADIERLVTAAVNDQPVSLGERATRAQFEQVRTVVDRINRLFAERNRLRERRADIDSEYEVMETRLENAVSEFAQRLSTRMNELLGQTDRETISEFSIEWGKRSDEDPANLLRQFDFELYAVASSDGNRLPVAELDAVDRELSALLLAFAGYLIHDVHENIPLLLLDEFDAASPETVSSVLEHLIDRIPYIVVAPPKNDIDPFKSVVNNVSSA
jgi:predicted  nucleic acid-binding Zn-ribbon protein